MEAFIINSPKKIVILIYPENMHRKVHALEQVYIFRRVLSRFPDRIGPELTKNHDGIRPADGFTHPL